MNKLNFTENEARTIIAALEFYKKAMQEALDVATNDDEVEDLKSVIEEIESVSEKF